MRPAKSSLPVPIEEEGIKLGSIFSKVFFDLQPFCVVKKKTPIRGKKLEGYFEILCPQYFLYPRTVMNLTKALQTVNKKLLENSLDYWKMLADFLSPPIAFLFLPGYT